MEKFLPLIFSIFSTSYETDINKFSQVFDDTDLHTLQSLQQLIQWVADISLYLLSVVPQVVKLSISILHNET